MQRCFLLLRLFARGCREIARIVFAVAVVVLSLLGALAVADALWPANLPEVRPIPCGVCWLKSESTRGTIEPALAMLDFVCPEVSAWARERRARGKLLHVSGDVDWLAAWAPATQTVKIHRRMMERPDAEIAAMLAHEYCHSRQSWLIRAQASIAYVAGAPEPTNPASLVEAPAYAWQEKVRRAICGASERR